MTKYDRKTLLNRLRELREYSRAKNFDYEIDDNIVAGLPEWIKKRVSERLYKTSKRENVSNPETILDFCNVTLASIQPFTEGEVICLIERKGDIVKIRFTLKKEGEHMANVNLNVEKWVCLIECAPGQEKEIPINKLERRIKWAKQKHPNAKIYIKVVSR